MEKSKRSRPSEDDDDDVVEIKRPIERPRIPPHYTFTCAAKVYGHKCILREDDEESNNNNIVVEEGKFSELFNLVPHVRINFRVDYILRKIVAGRVVEETLCSTHRCFYIRLFLVTHYEIYMNDFCVPNEYCQVRSGLEYDIHHPETFLFKFLTCQCCRGINGVDVIPQWVDDTKKFVEKLRTKAFDTTTGSDRRVYPIAMHIKLYTLQAENESVDDARRRAIMSNSSHVELGDKLISLLSTPPPYKFQIKLKNKGGRQMNCGTCSGKLRFLDYIFSCHALMPIIIPA